MNEEKLHLIFIGLGVIVSGIFVYGWIQRIRNEDKALEDSWIHHKERS